MQGRDRTTPGPLDGRADRVDRTGGPLPSLSTVFSLSEKSSGLMLENRLRNAIFALGSRTSISRRRGRAKIDG
jgi:hypothetical protein